jgi:SAM-dependent methyltransferase
MGVEEFLELFIKELEINRDLRGYYRLLDSKNRLLWRKAYLEQRLEYVYSHMVVPSANIWDVGCGYATTAIFLALNGYRVFGNTLEFYYDKIGSRLDYWSQFGNLNGLRIEYANLFDMPIAMQQYDAIIAQDTLHHLEPVQGAMNIFHTSLKPGGRLIVTEENGNNVFISLKNFSIRGFNRVTNYFDERLQKNILFGNENARSMQAWNEILNLGGFTMVEKDMEYIRIFPPCCFTPEHYIEMIEKERKTGKNLKLLREMLFFGINFTATTTNIR